MANRSRTHTPLRTAALLLSVVVLSACSTGAAPAPQRAQASGRSTTDARVKSFMGQTPPDVLTNGTWVSRAGPTSLAALRGRVVYLQFAFPQ
jgi:hypothetical protein